MPRAAFAALGTYVPDRVVTNEELTKHMETTDAWIQERTGIKERRWVREADRELGPRARGDEAGPRQGGLEAAGHRGDRLRLAVARSHVPGRRLLPQREARHPGRPALDIRNQCTGFLYGLSVADAWIRGGDVQARPARRLGDPLDRARRLDPRARRGGDLRRRRRRGAARGDRRAGRAASSRCTSTRTAASRRTSGLRGARLRSTTRASRAQMMAGARLPTDGGPEGLQARRRRRCRRWCARRSTKNGLTPTDLKLLVPHQANLRISQMVQRASGCRDDQVFNNIQQYGNTTAASIPLALAEAVEERGRPKRGDLVGLCAFGAGFHLGERPGTLVEPAAGAGEGPRSRKSPRAGERT